MRNDNLSFQHIASVLVKKDTQHLADELLVLFSNNHFFNDFVNVINLLFFQDIRNLNYDVDSKLLKSSVLSRFFKYHFCVRCIHYALKIVKRNEIYDDTLLVRDILHTQRETSVLIFLQCRTDSEMRVYSKILRGEPPIRRELAVDALARMCAMRYQYMNKYFCRDDIIINCSGKLRIIFDTYPNYTHVAQLLRAYECDLTKVLKNLKVTINYPVKQRSEKVLKTYQVHIDCRKKSVKLFYPMYQRACLAFEKSLDYQDLKQLIDVENECILEIKITEFEIDDGINTTKRVITIYPRDVLLIDGYQCLNLPTSTRRDILSKIIYPERTITRDEKVIQFSTDEIETRNISIERR